ncbi:MAG: hypothetical protein HY864_17210 [Chloroflexi bacterium]|nr:hypothetical protein [Chloroflexota bacterium]
MDSLKAKGNDSSGEPAQSQARPNFIRWLDALLDRIYRNRRHTLPPQGITEKIWGMPQNSENRQDGESYFLHYFQSQGYGPTPNECVTTSVLMCMNLLKDLATQGRALEPDRNIQSYVRELDLLGVWGWKYRFSTSSPLPGMMTPWQAILALKDFTKSLTRKYGRSFKVKMQARRKPSDLIENLQAGRLILIHGAWQMTIDRQNKNLEYNPLLALLGGMPHTMVLIGYDGAESQWLLLNPADPWPADKLKPVTPKFFKMTTDQLMDFWGRKFLFYPPRFSITVISPDG